MHLRFFSKTHKMQRILPTDERFDNNAARKHWFSAIHARCRPPPVGPSGRGQWRGWELWLRVSWWGGRYGDRLEKAWVTVPETEPENERSREVSFVWEVMRQGFCMYLILKSSFLSVDSIAMTLIGKPVTKFE